MTGYVSTRYYRAPEIMLTWQKYDVAGELFTPIHKSDLNEKHSGHLEHRVHFRRNAGGQATVPRQRPFVTCRYLSDDHALAYPYTDVNQFSIITELLGTPPDDVIQTICSENVDLNPIPASVES